jgi:hypothetical protein
MLDVATPRSRAGMGCPAPIRASTGFNGAWGLFPGSNLIVVSDINGRLFVVEYTGG